MTKIGFAITSSFCTIKEVLPQIKLLTEMGYDVIPITSSQVISENTRFGLGKDIENALELLTSHKVVSTIIEAEKFGPKEKLDALIVAPATGNFIAKMANGIIDTPVVMSAKATLRNNSPIIIGISTNDGLGINGTNVMKLINTKNIYFIPFGQDNYKSKPNSLVAHFDLLIPTLEEALENKQIQPVLKQYTKKQ